jgi:hypothetical protein
MSEADMSRATISYALNYFTLPAINKICRLSITDLQQI